MIEAVIAFAKMLFLFNLDAIIMILKALAICVFILFVIGFDVVVVLAVIWLLGFIWGLIEEVIEYRREKKLREGR